MTARVSSAFVGRDRQLAVARDVLDRIAQGQGGVVKGITVYRYGSKPDQVLTLLGDGDAALGPPVRADVAFAGGCAGHACEF